MDLSISRAPVPTHYVREQHVFAGEPDCPDIADPPSNVDSTELWEPVATRTAEEYIEAIAVVLELYRRDHEQHHRVWIETRIR